MAHMDSTWLSRVCGVFPVDSQSSPVAKSSVNIKGTSLRSYNGTETLEECAFKDGIFQNWDDYNSKSYEVSVKPLVKHVVNGNSCIALFGGTGSMEVNKYLLTHENKPGLIGRAANDLLEALFDNRGEKSGAVTFSWFTLNSSDNDSITDVLRTASAQPAAPNQTSHQPPIPPMANDLILRELGKGKGMIVPGLWEVDIASGDDVESIISYIQKIIPEGDHTKGHYHTVLQLTFNNTKINKTQSLQDQATHGRLSFLILSDLVKLNTPNVAAKLQYNSWIEQLSTTIGYLIDRRPSPPFHKSRLLLLLRDVINGRQYGSYTLLLHGDTASSSIISKWIEVSNLLTDQKYLVNHPKMHEASFLDASFYSQNSFQQRSPINNRVKSSPPPSATTSNRLRSPSPSGVTNPRMRSMANSTSHSINQVANHQSTHHSFQYPTGETEHALQRALEISQNEVMTLKSKLSTMTDNFEVCQTAYNTLVEQLKEDGALLKSKEQERYRKAIRDIKDYEKYKEVMEAAMIKLQKELEAINNENKKLNQEILRNKNSHQKTAKTSIHITNELHEKGSKLVELEEVANKQFKLIKSLTKDKQDMATELAEVQRREGTILMEKNVLERDVTTHLNTINELKQRLQGLVNEKAKIETSASREIHEMRETHSKALEILLEYQEENESLRAQLAKHNIMSPTSAAQFSGSPTKQRTPFK